ncbi:MAG: 1-acyl-sn-glycerol-3-phosphate acyltransferase [Chloroflexi bacterium]|nr:MAG: 1-acyl-sn-glycerol-3-phosphate acyltransferase [Chloroflexota bacterium]
MKERLQTAFYWLNVWTWIRAALWVVTSQDVVGKENIPHKGALIFTCNHFSVGDPPLLIGIFPRRIVWMAKQELFDLPLLGKLYNMGGFIPVRRFEGDLRAIRRSQDALRRGHVLGMFPEGTRSGGRLGRAEPGTALIALRTGALVLPVAIWGTEHVRLPRDLFRRTKAHARFGEPYRLPNPSRITREAVAAGTDEIMRRIAELLPPEYRGEYADTGAPSAAAQVRT